MGLVSTFVILDITEVGNSQNPVDGRQPLFSQTIPKKSWAIGSRWNRWTAGALGSVVLNQESNGVSSVAADLCPCQLVGYVLFGGAVGRYWRPQDWLYPLF